MDHEFEVLERRIQYLESRNRRMKWLGILFAVLVVTTAAWGQKAQNVVTQAQKFELRDDAGRLRAELAVLEGAPALRFFDAEGNVKGLLADDSFTIFKKGGDIQAVFAADGLSFEDGRDKVFVMFSAHEADQAGKLRINDYRNKIYSTITAEDLAKLHPNNAR
jgi:hypothetical protein